MPKYLSEIELWKYFQRIAYCANGWLILRTVRWFFFLTRKYQLTVLVEESQNQPAIFIKLLDLEGAAVHTEVLLWPEENQLEGAGVVVLQQAWLEVEVVVI